MTPPLLSPYYSIVKWVLIIEFIIVGCLGIYGLVYKKIHERLLQRKKKIEAGLKKALLDCVQKKGRWENLHLPAHWLNISYLIPVIIEIDAEIKDIHWEEIKKSIFDTTLFPKARKLTDAFRWSKRIQAIRCFSLFPDKSNEPYILRLLKDSIPIVKYTAAYCAAELGTAQSTNAIIDEMNLANRFLRHPFRDSILKGDPEDFTYIEKRLEKDEDPYIRVSCLELISHQMNHHAAELAARDLYAPHKNLRLAAIRALGHYPQASPSLLIPLLKDPEWEIRSIAARALGYLKVHEAIPELAALLKDPAWWVRMNAALALKRIGKEGEKVLEIQDPKENNNAYEIAQYVLPLSITRVPNE